jgi:hypothetical protein
MKVMEKGKSVLKKKRCEGWCDCRVVNIKMEAWFIRCCFCYHWVYQEAD